VTRAGQMIKYGQIDPTSGTAAGSLAVLRAAILGPFVARSAGAGFTVVPSIKSTSCLIASRTCIACIITCEKLGLTFAYI